MKKILSSLISFFLIPVMLLVSCLLWIIGVSDEENENDKENESNKVDKSNNE